MSNSSENNNSSRKRSLERKRININPTYQIRDSITTNNNQQRNRRTKSRARELRSATSERLSASERHKVGLVDYSFLLEDNTGAGHHGASDTILNNADAVRHIGAADRNGSDIRKGSDILNGGGGAVNKHNADSINNNGDAVTNNIINRAASNHHDRIRANSQPPSVKDYSKISLSVSNKHLLDKNDKVSNNDNGEKVVKAPQSQSSSIRRSKKRMSSTARRSLSMNDAHCYGIDELLEEMSEDGEDGGGLNNRREQQNGMGTATSTTLKGERRRNVDKKLQQQQTQQSQQAKQIQPSQQAKQTQRRMSRRRPTTTLHGHSPPQNATMNDGNELLVMSSIKILDKSTDDSSNTSPRDGPITSHARLIKMVLSENDDEKEDDDDDGLDKRGAPALNLTSGDRVDRSRVSTTKHQQQQHQQQRRQKMSSKQEKTNDGNELLAISSTLDHSELSRGSSELIMSFAAAARSNKSNTTTTSHLPEQQQQRPTRHRRKASKVRRSLSMNDAHCYHLEDLQFESDNDDHDDEGNKKESRKGGNQGRGDRDIGAQLEGITDNKVHTDAPADAAGGGADAAGGTSYTSSAKRRGRRRPSLLLEGAAAAVSGGEESNNNVDSNHHHHHHAHFKSSIKELSRNEEEEGDDDETNNNKKKTKKSKRREKHERPRQRRLDNKNIAAAATTATTEYSSSTLTSQPPKKKQPLTSSESDGSCPEMNRIYNTPPRSNDTRRKNPEQQQQQPKHPSLPLPPPLPPQAPPPTSSSSSSSQQPTSSNFSTNSNNSIMDDYIQLKLKVAELQSDLQHFQAETSKYKVKLFHLQKENEELRLENQTLSRQQGNRIGGGGGGGSSNELKEENDFMKRVLYNLERLGKIDKVDELLKSRLDDADEKRRMGLNNHKMQGKNAKKNTNVGTNNNNSNSSSSSSNNLNVGNRRLLLRKAHSSKSSRRGWSEEYLDWSSKSSSVQQSQQMNDAHNGPQRRGSILDPFRRFSAPFAPPPPPPPAANNNDNDDDVVEVEEHPMTNTAVDNTRIRRRSFSHGSLSSLFRWPTEENQDTSSNEATVQLDDSGRIQFQHQQQQQPRPNSFGEAIKNIQRSFSSNPNLKDNNDSAKTKGGAAAAATGKKGQANDNNNDGDKKDVPEYVHTDEEANLLQVSEISSDVVPSSRIPTMGGTTSNHNVDIRQTAKQASTRPMNNRGNRDRGLFGSFIREIIREES